MTDKEIRSKKEVIKVMKSHTEKQHCKNGHRSEH